MDARKLCVRARVGVGVGVRLRAGVCISPMNDIVLYVCNVLA